MDKICSLFCCAHINVVIISYINSVKFDGELYPILIILMTRHSSVAAQKMTTTTSNHQHTATSDDGSDIKPF